MSFLLNSLHRFKWKLPLILHSSGFILLLSMFTVSITLSSLCGFLWVSTFLHTRGSFPTLSNRLIQCVAAVSCGDIPVGILESAKELTRLAKHMVLVYLFEQWDDKQKTTITTSRYSSHQSTPLKDKSVWSLVFDSGVAEDRSIVHLEMAALNS